MPATAQGLGVPPQRRDGVTGNDLDFVPVRGALRLRSHRVRPQQRPHQGRPGPVRSLPMARSAVLAGRTLADLLRNTFILGLQLAVGVALGFRWQNGLAGMLAAMGLALAFGFACSWLMAYLGLAIRNTEAIQAAIYMVVFPMTLTSSVFLPTQTMPAGCKASPSTNPSPSSPRAAWPHPRPGRAARRPHRRRRSPPRPHLDTRHPRGLRTARRTLLPAHQRLTRTSDPSKYAHPPRHGEPARPRTRTLVSVPHTCRCPRRVVEPLGCPSMIRRARLSDHVRASASLAHTPYEEVRDEHRVQKLRPAR